MQIRPVDVHDDVALRAVYDVDTRASLLGREDLPHWTWPEMAAMYRSPDSGERFEMVGGYVEDRLVGFALVYLTLLDNLEKCWVVVEVDPAAQGRGHGRELLAHVCAIAAADGRTTIMAEAKIPFDRVADHRYRRFAHAAGFEFSNIEVVRHLALPVPERDLHAWAADAAPRHEGYRIETHVDEVPEELLDSYCVLLGQLSVDAPTGAVDFEEEVYTPERVAETIAMLHQAGRHRYDTLAVTPDGLVAAHSTLVTSGPGRHEVFQWGTFVHREHRGRRLGLATKAANLLAVQRAHPDATRVSTQNGETNQWMIAINEQMGFEPVEASMEFVRRG